MGLNQTIHFVSGVTPEWDAIRARLVAGGESPVLRMIDGLPAFPEETPVPEWKELRLGLAAGMVTIRRNPGQLTCVIWGNADAALQLTCARVVLACAQAGAGQVETADGLRSAEQFAETIRLK